MEQRALGRTGLLVSRIGFGTGGTGGVMGRGAPEERRAVVTRAIDAGITYFDTSPAYDATRSEANLGETLQELGLRPVVSTKVPLHIRDLADTYEAVARSAKASMERLRLDHIDLLQLHAKLSNGSRDEFPDEVSADAVLGSSGIADAMERLQRDGYVGHIGFTGIGHPEAVGQVLESGRFGTVQVMYNLLNPSAGMAMPAGFRGADNRLLIDRAAELGVGVIVIRSLAAGALAGTPASHRLAGGWSRRAAHDLDGDRERARALSFLVHDGQTMPQAAVRFALSHPGVDTVLAGFSEPAQVDELTALADGARITDQELAQVRSLAHPD